MFKAPALISFITAGDPSTDATLRFMKVLDGYADVIELGIPFSDPVADGKAIQGANYRALESKTTVDSIFDIVRKFRKSSDTPIVLMTYYNIIYRRGVEKFMQDARDAGADGVISVDLPFDEAGDYQLICDSYGIKPIFMVAPNTADNRLKKIDDSGCAFIYLVSHYGITGMQDDVQEIAFEALHKTKSLCKNQLAVGFGISRSEHVKKLVGAGADAVIVGSALVKIIEEFGEDADEKLEDKIKELREGLR